MHSLIITYGSAGWRARKILIEDLLKERPGPPHLYNDVLILVPVARLKRTYGRLLLDIVRQRFDCEAISQPDIQPLHLFLQRLFAHSRGPTLIDETGRLVLLEWLVKEYVADRPAFGKTAGLIAPSLAAAVADMIEEFGGAGVTPDRLAGMIADSDFSDKPQVRLLTDVYFQYEKTLADKGLVDPAGMLRILAETFDPSWLAGYRRVIIDGIHQTTDLEAAVLRKIAASANCTVLIEAPTAESLRSAREYHPLRLVREFAGKLGLAPGEPSEPVDPETEFLSASVFPAASFAEAAAAAPASFSRDIRLLSAINMREEVSLIARAVKDSLRSGTAPDAILVAFPSVDEYGPLAEEIFRDYGIPYNRALGRQLSSSPVATSLIALLQAVQDDFSGAALLRIFGSPFLRYGNDRSLAPALDRLMRGQRILNNRERWLAAARFHAADQDGKNIVTAPLTELFSVLDPFRTKDAIPLADWMDRLAGLIAWSGLAERVGLIKGPLNTNLQAFRKLSETLASLSHAGRQFPGYRSTFDEWLFLLKKTLMHTRFQVPPDDEGGVQVLGLEESASHAWSEIYLGGLIDGKFPQRRGQNIFLPEATLETLGIRLLEQTRLKAAYHFYRLLLSAPRVTLTWPENQGDRPVVASPFLVELKALELAGLLNRGVDKREKLQFSLRPEDARSVPELAKAVAVDGAESLDGLFRTELPGLENICAALAQPPGPPPMQMPPSDRRTFSVTELDDYLNCPYDYHVRRILGIEPLEEVTEDISPRDRGSRVHGILKLFYEEWRDPVTDDSRSRARDLLFSLADKAFQRDADTFRNRRENEHFRSTIAERFLSSEIECWALGFRPVYLERKIDAFPIVLTDGTNATLTAKIDRIDADDKGNFIIVDYKTGNYPQPANGIDQKIFQLPVYALMAMRAFAGKSPALHKPVGLAYYDLAGKFGKVARDVVLYDKDAGYGHPSVKPKASPKSAVEFQQILDLSMQKARTAAEKIIAGEYPSQPQDKNRCGFCANRMMCKQDEESYQEQ